MNSELKLRLRIEALEKQTKKPEESKTYPICESNFGDIGKMDI
jgi:hypothetical protein